MHKKRLTHTFAAVERRLNERYSGLDVFRVIDRRRRDTTWQWNIMMHSIKIFHTKNVRKFGIQSEHSMSPERIIFVISSKNDAYAVKRIIMIPICSTSICENLDQRYRDVRNLIQCLISFTLLTHVELPLATRFSRCNESFQMYAMFAATDVPATRRKSFRRWAGRRILFICRNFNY